ncbi:MAG: response regulator [Candidatus Omnitrophica bacterium]|nr:response regulator [Candidatus Omnitrophota bacterium]
MRKIMIVDDEIGITEAFERAFRKDYAVITANDGQEAMELIGKEKPDLIILDWRLKGDVEGKDVLCFSKREYPSIPVYVLTASTHLEKEIRSLGADDCLRKPCLQLKEKINAVLPSTGSLRDGYSTGYSTT